MFKRFKLLSMAALVALSVAACDEGEDLGPDITGSITGTVTVDGAGRSGLTVTLSTGATQTTSATGQYTFADVPAGAYTVAITAPAGTACPATSQAAVVATAGQVVTVNFACSAIRNSSIVVTVGGSTGPLAGVTVTLSGAGTGTQATSAAGLASFTGLAAGNYTVTISGIPAGQTCATMSQPTTVAAGETRSLTFTCTSAMTAQISGRLFLDENDKNNRDDGSALEPSVAAANVAITLEGPTVGVMTTVQTDAMGNFAFPNLAAGQYNVSIDSDDPDLPDNVGFGLASETIGPITLAAGATATTGALGGFAFDLLEQTVTVLARLGSEEEPGTAPVEGVEIVLYPTAQDAENLANELGRGETDSTGAVSFTFLREDDAAPGGGTDNIVFARMEDAPTAHTLDADQQNPMEIEYLPSQGTFTAPDVFDFINRHVVLVVDVLGVGTMAPLEGWNVSIFRGTEDGPTGLSIDVVPTDEDGRAEFDRTDAPANMPEDYWFRMSTAQPAAGGTGWDEEAVGEEGEAVEEAVDPATPNIDQWLHFVHEGLVAEGDEVDVGNFILTFTEVDVIVRVYHEADDEEGFTDGDNFGNATQVEVTLTYEDEDGEEVDSTLLAQPLGQGLITFEDVPTNSGPYTLTATSLLDSLMVLPDSVLELNVNSLGDLGGGSIETMICPGGEEDEDDCGTFAIKFINGVIRGTVMDSTGTVPAEGISIRVTADPATIAGHPLDTVLVTDENGAYRVRAHEGLYTVSIEGDTEDWVFEGQDPVDVDVEGNDDVVIVDFTAIYNATEIHGVVVNDRDADENTIDQGEALAGVTIQLFRDNDTGSASVSNDSLIAETSTDATGGYSFTGLREARYIVRGQSPTGATVLRGFSGSGSVQNTQTVTTTAIAPADDCTNANFLSRVGVSDPTCFDGTTLDLPRWDYAANAGLNTAPTHFTFLYTTGTVTGRISTPVGDTAVANIVVTLARCATSPAQPSPPAAGACTTFAPGFTTVVATTSATGTYTFANLMEGVYEVTPVPAGVRVDFDPTNPPLSSDDKSLATLLGNNDTETANFVTGSAVD